MRFTKPPAVPFNAHRPIINFEDLDDIFTWQVARTLSASFTLQYDKVLYLVEPSSENQRLAGRRVNVIDYPDGRIAIRYEGRDLPYREFDKLTHVHQGDVVSHKRLGAMLQMISNHRCEKRGLKGPTRRYPAPARLT
jgi:hypothetical protein